MHPVRRVSTGERGALWARVVRLQAEGELRFAVAGTLGNWIGAVGERTGVRPLTLNRLRFADWHHRSLDTAPAAIAALLSLYPMIADAVDLGCGTGVYVHELRAHGVHAVGYERSAYARRVAKRTFGLDVYPFDVASFEGPGKRFDICVCLEVAHYLVVDLTDMLVAHCARAAPLVAFSAPAPAGAGDARLYWSSRFAAYGMRPCVRETAILEQQLRGRLPRNSWLADHIALFIRD
jgi:SAM-dependent methyltransferase